MIGSCTRILVASAVGLLCALAMSPVASAILPPKHWQAVSIAQAYLGDPYLPGGANPEGFDEGGLVVFIYTQLGIAAPQDLVALSTTGHEVDMTQREPGDVVLWSTAGGSPRAGIHVRGDVVICAGRAAGEVTSRSIRGATWARRLLPVL
jgi:cell wall-associated NlpC family hydrolase